MHNHRYMSPQNSDHDYYAYEYAQSCEVHGLKLAIKLTESIRYTNQGEPIYDRSAPIVSYGFVEDPVPGSSQTSEKMQNEDEFNSKVIYLPRFYGEHIDSKDNRIEKVDRGTIISIIDDMPLEEIKFGEYIVEDSDLSPDRMYWKCNCLIHRIGLDESEYLPKEDTYPKQNFSMLKSKK